MASINTRIAALAAALERERLKEDLELDDLSLSLYEFDDRMASLTDDEIEAMATEVDEDGKQMLTLEQAHAFVDEWRQRRAERTPRQQQRIAQAIAKKKKSMKAR